MASENTFLFHALWLGIYITFIYDLFRVFRRVIPHKRFLISVEDFGFWVYCAIKVFLLMYRESNGTLRWFAIVGAFSGMLLYLKLVSPLFVKYVTVFLQKILHIIGKILKWMFGPAYRLYRKIREQAARAVRRQAVKRLKRREIYRKSVKKKLTLLKKALKINL